MQHWRAVCIAVVVLVAALPAVVLPADRPPNIVIILADDLGYSDVGVYGAEGFSTPHLDRMASEGVRFTDFHTMPSCSPTRAALLTGCYPQRVGVPRVLFPEDTIGLHPDEVTLAEILKQQGYATACIGKWHLGHHKSFLPTAHGFDHYFGIPYSNDMSPATQDVVNERSQAWPPLPLMRGTDIIEQEPDQRLLTRRLTEEAVAFMEEHKDQPLLLYLAHPMPHVPLFVSEAFDGKSERGMYGDVVMELDRSVGQILASIDRLGLDEQTLVIFLSDNGPWLQKGDRGGSARGLRAGKATQFEGATRVPCIMRWSGRIPAGQVSAQLAKVMDLLPTIAAIAGAQLDPQRPIDGSDITPILMGQPWSGEPRTFYHFLGQQLRAVRRGPWKLHVGRSDNMQLAIPSLFNLDDDPAETSDLADQHPQVVKELQQLAEQVRNDLGDALTQRQGHNRRPPGRLE
jgi:arylsulfatase A